jgi:hypothetical protein
MATQNIFISARNSRNFLRLPYEVMAEVEEHGTVWVNGAVVEHGQGEVL